MNKKGFTLIEMLLVITLIAAITAVVIPNIVSSINEGKTKEYESYVKLLEDNLEMYKTDLGVNSTIDVRLEQLRARVSELNIGKCVAQTLVINKSEVNDIDKYSYYACIKCDDGKYYSSKELGTDSCK